MLLYRQRLFNLGVPVDHPYDDLAPIGIDGQPLVTENSNGSDEVFWNAVGDNDEFWRTVHRSISLLDNL